MREAGKVGIGRVVIRSKQQLAALRPSDDVLTLTTMLWGDEVLSPDRMDELESVAEAEATSRELKMAEQLISSLSTNFEPDKFHDEYSRAGARPDRAQGGRRADRDPAPGRGAPEAVPDLMAALEASLAAVSSGDSDKPAPAKKAPARKKSGKTSDSGSSSRSRAKARS